MKGVKSEREFDWQLKVRPEREQRRPGGTVFVPAETALTLHLYDAVRLEGNIWRNRLE